MEELVELYREGKIENIGVSNFNLREYKIAKSILDKEGIPLFGVQNHYSDIIDLFKKNNQETYIMERVANFLKEADPCKSKGGNLCI